MDDADKQNKIPSGKLVRSGIIGVTTARVGIKKLGHISRKPFLSEESVKESGKKNDEDMAAIVFKALSILKGGPLKLAQMMSMEMELLPEAFRKELSKSTSQVPPMNRALIRKVIITELGAAPEKIFREFEPVPFAAASLGQVHRAVSHEGVELAVKVQYPGVAQGVKSDLEMINSILKITPYAGMMNGVVSEIQERIFEELDYVKEAANITWFREHSDRENIVIPEVVSELSCKRVLSTTRVEGLHLDEWLETNPGRDKRDRIGQILCDFFMKNTSQHGIIHADPNPGNFIFTDDGRLGVIDFGCVKVLDMGFLENLKVLENAAEMHDIRRVKDIYKTIGISYKENSGDREFEEFIIKWIECITRPIRSDFFDFSKNVDYFTEIFKLAPWMYRYMDKIDGSFLYFGRTEYGLYRILHKLGARVKINFFNTAN